MHDTISSWCFGELSAAESAALTEAVKHSGEALEAYKALIALFTEPKETLRENPSMSVHAQTQEEVPYAKLLMDLPLPHLGSNARLQGRKGATGTWWALLDAPTQWSTFVPYTDGVSTMSWEDPTVGPITVTVTELEKEEWRFYGVLDALVKLEKHPEHPRALAIAMAVARSFLPGGEFYQVLQSASASFNEADLDTEWEGLLCDVVRIRMSLDSLADLLDNPELDQLIHEGDQAVDAYKDALLLLSDDHRNFLYECVDEDVCQYYWWGYPLLLDTEVPLSLLLATLEDMKSL